MKTFNKEQLLIIKLANALSQMIDAAEEDSKNQNSGEYAETVDFLNTHRLTLNEAKYYLENHKTVPNDTKNKAYISNPHHLVKIGKYLAFDEVRDFLSESCKEYKAVTGLKLALTLVDSFASDFKSSLNIYNIKFAAKHGLDINEGALAIQSDDDNICLTIIKEEQ